MSVVGKVESLWRYPVKGMRGEALDSAFVGFSGIYGDRIFAIHSSASAKGFPYLTGREQSEMLKYCPRFRHPAKAAQPINWDEAISLAPGITITPLYADLADLVVDAQYHLSRPGKFTGFMKETKTFLSGSILLVFPC